MVFKIFRKENAPTIMHLGGTESMEIRIGYNTELRKYWIQLFHRKYKDHMRILLNEEEFHNWLINGTKILQLHTTKQPETESPPPDEQ